MLDSRILRCGTGLLAALWMGCATPQTRDDVEARVRRSAGVGSDAKVLTLFASSQSEAWVLVVEAKSNGPIVPSRRLALGFEAAASQPLRYVVGGPFSQLNDRVLQDAFTLSREPRLPGLDLVFVSPAAPSEELARLARAYGARLQHRLYADAP